MNNNEHNFAYLRQSGSERFLIVLNPSADPSLVRINAIKSGNLAPQIFHGARACIEGDDILINLDGVSYGIFKL